MASSGFYDDRARATQAAEDHQKRMWEAGELMSQGGQISMVFTPRLNEWQGFRSIEAEVKDFQAGPDARLA